VFRGFVAALCFPSVSDLVFVLLLVALTCGALAKGLLGDAGIGWHIRTGELIRSTHEIPRVDPFPPSCRGRPGLLGMALRLRVALCMLGSG